MIIYYNEGKTICKTSVWYIGGKKDDIENKEESDF